MNASLISLAAAAGVDNGYWDGLGVRRDLQEPTAAALLAALGIDPSMRMRNAGRSLTRTS